MDLVEMMKVWLGRGRNLPVLLRLVLLGRYTLPAAKAHVRVYDSVLVYYYEYKH